MVGGESKKIHLESIWIQLMPTDMEILQVE